jgi:O-acetyl-ADP-ribose deacetylase (regulator of RNase III)
MVEVRKGDLFESGAYAIVNTVNCVGVMGWIKPGKVWAWATTTGPNTHPQVIYNFATKDHWRNPSKMEWIASGLDDLKSHVIMGVESLALPALGCTNGGLRFEDVRALIEEKLNDLEIPVILYEPQ